MSLQGKAAAFIFSIEIDGFRKILDTLWTGKTPEPSPCII